MQCGLSAIVKQLVYSISVYIADWRKSVADPEMEFDDIGTDIALSQGELMLRVYVCVYMVCVSICLCGMFFTSLHVMQIALTTLQYTTHTNTNHLGWAVYPSSMGFCVACLFVTKTSPRYICACVY